MSDTELMMSSELQGQIPDLEEQAGDFGNLAVVLCKVPGQEDAFHSVLIGVTSGDRPELEVRTDLKTALDLFKNRADITFSEIQIIHQESTIELGGPFMITDIKLHTVDQTRQSCTLKFNLSSQVDKQVIF